MARKFFYVCAGLFLLALSWHLGSRSAGAQASTNPEVAVLSGEVADGGTIPLPHYQDGTEALESECRWITSVRTRSFTDHTGFVRCSSDGRTVRIYGCVASCGLLGDCSPPYEPGCAPYLGTANYLIIAVRQTGPTPVKAETLGQVKARYR